MKRELFAAEGVSLLRVDYPRALVQPRHAHEYASVTLVLAGGVEETVRRRTSDGGPLSVVAKRARVEHACRWGLTGARTLSVQIRPTRWEEGDPEGWPPKPWAWMERPEAAEALISMYRSARQGRLVAEADDLVLELLASLTPSESTHEYRISSPPSWLFRAEEEMRDRSPRRPATRELADRAGVHPVHFARVFRGHFGLSPTEFARWLRLRRALTALVADPSRDASRIAHQCGFSDHSHFCREIRRFLDVSPSYFRSLANAVTGA